MIAVVLDSNVYISALLFGGNPRRIIRLAEIGLIQLYSSRELQAEVERVLTAKFHWQQMRVIGATKYLWSLTRRVRPTSKVTDCVDSDDNRVLECAIEARAGWLITGDQHLLALHPYRHVAIVTPRQFLDSSTWRKEE